MRRMKPALHTDRLIAFARKVLSIEAGAVAALDGRVGEAFVSACNLINECNGRLVVTGMGKSGHIGDKIAATFASTGTPAFTRGILFRLPCPWKSCGTGGRQTSGSGKPAP